MKDEYPPHFAPETPRFGAAEIVANEKRVLQSLGFDLHVPTVFWFTSTYLCVAGYEAECPTRLTAQFFADLVLLDADMQQMRASLVAQACMVLGVYFTQRKATSCDERCEEMCDVALEQWMQFRDLVHSGEAKESVEMQMCWLRLIHVVNISRRTWKIEEALQAVEQRHQPTSHKLSYPSVWPHFLSKYLVQ